MRVKTEIWVAALVRRVFGEGGFAAIIKRGAPEAGAAFILVRDRDGGTKLFGPAPQTSYESAKPDERQFSSLDEDAASIEARLQREQRFDPDIWIVELELARSPAEELFPVTKP